MAAGGPAGPLLQETRVINVTDQNDSWRSLLLQVALKAKRLIALVQESLVDRAVGGMTDNAPLAQGFVLIHPRPSLRAMTLEAGVVLA
jgi:hypothetical protein